MEIWQELTAYARQEHDLRDLMQHRDRFKRFSHQGCGILFDFSKQKIDDFCLAKLLELARHCQVSKHLEELFTGRYRNSSEDRCVWHPLLRAPLQFNNPLSQEVIEIRQRMATFIKALTQGEYVGATGELFTDIISIGIGGSHLGPQLLTEALPAQSTLRVHFLANVDSHTLDRLLAQLNPATTLCLINSKTFTTLETMSNAHLIRAAWSQQLPTLMPHFWAITAAPTQAQDWGIPAEQILPFWDWVGGRFSVWSAIGLSAATVIGFEAFERVLAGAYAMDQHVQHAPLPENLGVLSALVGIWNTQFLKHKTVAVIPYADGLASLPSYLQQLVMESNGKRVDRQGRPLSTTTSPIVWGGVGCNGQHAYMQCLHQGTQEVPVDFIIAAQGRAGYREQHNLLIASCLSQSKALMEGCSGEPAQVCPGNRASSTFVLPVLDAYHLGALLALYEHKVFIEGVILGLNSFDQWGVQLGKKLLPEILAHVTSSHETNIDQSSAGLLTFMQQ